METIMSEQPPTLKERIDLAIQPDAAVASADLAALIKETETEIAETNQLWRSADKTLPLGLELMAAISVMEGLRLLLPKLQARYEYVHELEQLAAFFAARKAEWLAEYEALKRERDALAEELPQVYPDAAGKIANLFARIANNDAALSELHQSRPDGLEQYLRSAELHARGLSSFSRNTPSLLASVHLFDWDSGQQIWPVRRSSLPASGFIATSMQVSGRRFTDEWWKDNEQRAAAQRAEQQRMADFYARETQWQEERENAEARERFAALQRKNRG
jgi:hypothetical protein